MPKHSTQQLIATEALLPGMVIVQVTKQNGPLKIRKSGLVSSHEMIQGLIEMGIQEVEIDPSQTVEIELPVAQKSSTLQLLQTNSGIQSNTDSQLQDQFKRSLFLPTVQDIPAAWQFHLHRYGLLSLVIAIGFILGLSAALLPHYFALRNPLIVSAAKQADSHNSVQSAATVDISKQETLVETTNDLPIIAKAQDANQQVQASKPEVELSNSTADNLEQTTIEAKQQTRLGQEKIADKAEEKAPLSAELLKRFEKVMQQMEAEEGSNTSAVANSTQFSDSELKLSTLSSDSAVKPSNEKNVQDVPRIDQLPAWVMTELPAMAFSAHMYASDPRDRWVKVNGVRKMEGDFIDNKAKIVRITPQHIILLCKGHEFSMRAMTDW